jgi:membrane protease YdiL (CAAX protease family)
MALSYFILAISVALALIVRVRLYLYTCIVVASVCAIYQDVLDLSGLLFLLLLTAATCLSFRSNTLQPLLKNICLILVTALALCFVLHYIPGFENILVLDHVSVSAASKPYSMRLNFDKVMAALIIYIFSHLHITEQRIDSKAAKQTFIAWLSCVLVILSPAVISGYIRFDPKIPIILPIWLLHNFLFVCFSEEVIFRGLIQKMIKGWLPNKTNFAYLSILLASLIFGLAHYRDGMLFMGFAAICGLFYGYVYERTNRILCAMLIHFGLNLTHLLLFTYPAAVVVR